MVTTMATPLPFDLAPGSMLFGHYRLIETAGLGTFRAIDVLRSQPVALVLAGPSDREVSRRSLVQAGLVLHDIASPLLPIVRDAAGFGEWAYYVTDWLDGVSLADRLDADRLVSRSEWKRIGEALFDAIGTVHDHGIVHGNLAATCVLFDRSHRWTTMRVSGFGVPPRDPGRFASPEVRAGRPPAAADDLYSIGVILLDAAGLRPDLERTPEIAPALDFLALLMAPRREGRPTSIAVARSVFEELFVVPAAETTTIVIGDETIELPVETIEPVDEPVAEVIEPVVQTHETVTLPPPAVETPLFQPRTGVETAILELRPVAIVETARPIEIVETPLEMNVSPDEPLEHSNLDTQPVYGLAGPLAGSPSRLVSVGAVAGGAMILVAGLLLGNQAAAIVGLATTVGAAGAFIFH